MVPGLSGEFQSGSRSSPAPTLRGGEAGSVSSEEPCEAAGGSGLLGAGGQNHRGGETVHTQSRDVDLITAVGRKLRRRTEPISSQDRTPSQHRSNRKQFYSFTCLQAISTL